MNLFVHLSYTLVMARILNLDKFNMVLALIFGIFIDLDHIYYYIPNLIKKRKIIQIGYKHRTFIQEPVFYPVVIFFSYIYRTLTPIIFFSLHLLLDYMIKMEQKPFWPLSHWKYNKGMKSYGRLYWVFTIISLILFIVFFLYNNNYVYLVEAFS